MKVTIKEVAKKAGVSASTVSRVVGNYGYVGEKNRKKILAVIRELDYHPNAIARSMVKKSTSTIGLVITDITNPFFAYLARGVEEVAWQHGYTLILANTDEDLTKEQAIVSALLEKQVDGLILVPASSSPTPHLQEVLKREMPLTLVDRRVKDCLVDVIMVNNQDGARQAVAYLIERGHRRIGMVYDNPEISTNMERLAGYREAFRDAGLTIPEDLVRSCQYTQQSAYAVVAQLLKVENPPTAIFTANNFMTLGAVKAVREAGLQIPTHIALVGFDDLDWNEYNLPQLTSVAQPVHEMGKVAAQRLIARLKGEKTPPLEIRLNTRFIIRQSC
ncbi:MAG: LacI family transcriptional regulator [Chloroflexi bacterium]|nr:LacI family transcriptional regulator [Chloroflexota bacterium]